MEVVIAKLLFNVGAASVIGGLADCICQLIELNVASKKKKCVLDEEEEEPEKEYDTERTVRFMLSFGCFGGANSFFWYQYVLPHLSHGKFYKMMLWDNLFYNTYFVLVGLTMNEMLKERTLEDPTPCESIAHNFPATWATAEVVLLPADVIMFTWVPRDFRVIYIKSVDVVWMCGASYFANRHISEFGEEKHHHDHPYGELDGEVGKSVTLKREDDGSTSVLDEMEHQQEGQACA
eukprot:Sspe_Gene.52109::Locus_28880_Transcript_1_2_Confidence_0.667_Length_1266::g.52109::m.52109/K13348/MPV17; protein Mpv17